MGSKGMVTIHYEVEKAKDKLKVNKVEVDGTPATKIDTNKNPLVLKRVRDLHQVIYHHGSPGYVTYILPDGTAWQIPVPQ